ncbi:MAG: SGNH/GDSL hydrolase family protein [Paludibacter sp.]
MMRCSAQKPTKIIIENDNLKWTAEGEYWEVQVRSKIDNSVLRSETVTEKSFSLVGLEPNSIVYVRTVNNGFYSGWAFMSDVIKVGCVGDSNTYGAEATDRTRYAWPVQIRSMLGSKYETRNFGVNGALMMSDKTDAWKNKTAYSDNKAYDPDKIVIALGTNDSKDGYWNAATFKNSYINLINEFKGYSAAPEIYMAIPIKAYSSTWAINDQTIREQVIPTMKEISKEMGLPLIDLYAVTNNIASLMAADGIHPKDEGLGIMARKIADIMLAEKPKIEIVNQLTVANHAAYYWYKNNVLISNANGVNYIATETGSYKVAVKLNGTTDDVIVSDPFELTQTNVILSATCNYLTAISEPKQNDITISSFADQIQISNGASSMFYIYDIGGRLVEQYKLNHDTEFINSSSLKKGIYIGQLRKENQIISIKLLK